MFSQAPSKISYQAVIRDAKGVLIKDGKVGIRISILKGLATGTVVYSESQLQKTNINGVLSLEIGTGKVINGVFADINWASGTYYIQTEVDLNGGASYTIISTTQFLSVPFALFANSAGNGFSGNYNDLKNIPIVNSTPLTIIPQIALPGQRLVVSFSGGDNYSFTQSSPTCNNLIADVVLKITQGSTTQGSSTQGSSTQGSDTYIYPLIEYFINSKRFDTIFDIPSYVPSGFYDIILSPSSQCPYTIKSSFLID